ncbi:MAG TPA: hypothetical protein VJN88_14945 [Ktedonobacterales bacterium]|nr:hypothetical protein [Ktedonobacterales bacterium]
MRQIEWRAAIQYSVADWLANWRATGAATAGSRFTSGISARRRGLPFIYIIIEKDGAHAQ